MRFTWDLQDFTWREEVCVFPAEHKIHVLKRFPSMSILKY